MWDYFTNEEEEVERRGDKWMVVESLLDGDLWVRTRILMDFSTWMGLCGCAARLCLVPCAGLCVVVWQDETRPSPTRKRSV